jgi:hypothetical protein
VLVAGYKVIVGEGREDRMSSLLFYVLGLLNPLRQSRAL